jgi:rRNA maturation endonuclease Nob1
LADLYAQNIWAIGCNYMVAKPGDICTKCGKEHNLKAKEAKAWPFNKEKDTSNEETTD